ncbi:MAG: hypothetical protein BWX80_02771 [Candidatus Hydrogenedentes bacterium ADurb.Bin101]|nr:MAG: hypothetical protein BWX80_02771 [Candidatus Hydrogenedentes bacterium ADurb.Bin101]
MLAQRSHIPVTFESLQNAFYHAVPFRHQAYPRQVRIQQLGMDIHQVLHLFHRQVQFTRKKTRRQPGATVLRQLPSNEKRRAAHAFQGC